MNSQLVRKCLLWGILAVVLAVLAYMKFGQADADEQVAGGDAASKIPSIGKQVATGGAIKGWRPYTTRDRQIKWADANFILHGFARGKFENLEAFIEEFDRTYPDGDTYRNQFYAKLLNYDDYNNHNAGRYHDKYLKNIEAWVAENPERGEPAIARAAFEIYLAWYARGSGYANTVTKKGWENFAKHIQQARKILENAPAAAKKDPYYYQLWITTHLAQGGSLQDVLDVFEAGQNVDPTYSNLYSGMTNYLQPKWHGENIDDWHRWLVAALKHPRLSDDDKLVLYGDLVRSNIRGSYEDVEAASTTIYEAYGIDKDRYMRGLAACCRRYASSSDWPSAYLYHAVKANSESDIKKALKLMDRKFAAGVFGGEKEFFIMLSAIEERYPKLAPLAK